MKIRLHDWLSKLDLASMTASVALFGAAFDTGNLGVSALGASVIDGMAQRIPGVRIVSFDNGLGRREPEPLQGGGRLLRVGARRSLRLDRQESHWRIGMACRLGGIGSTSAREILGADAVLDISGGDSFTDLYGRERWESVRFPKRLALMLGKPLVLLPQTYGPFQSDSNRQEASRLVRGAALAWARDAHSFKLLRVLAGDACDESRHRCGVDVAFTLQPREPRLDLGLADVWLRGDARYAARGRRVYGINVSGLIYNRPDASRDQYGLRADYRAVVRGLVRGILDNGDARVVLVPHTLTPAGHYESDVEASKDVFDSAGDRDRVAILTGTDRDLDERETKWCISKCDWFCGTRMHSTIAALSSGVPTAAIAYSDKTLGVFETCGQGHHVADPRKLSTEELIEHLWSSWEAREQAKADLTRHLPGVLGQAEEQMDDIAQFCMRCASQREARRA